jgi:hypothetical protein
VVATVSDDEETENPRSASLRAEFEAERWLVSLAIGWAYVDEETRERALTAAFEPDMIGFAPLRTFMSEYLVRLGPEFVSADALAAAAEEMERSKISPHDFASTLYYLNSDAPPPLDDILATLRVVRLRRRLTVVASRLSFAAATASPEQVRWLLSFAELHALPDVPDYVVMTDEVYDEEEPTPHDWEAAQKEFETKAPETKRRRRLPVVNTTDFNLWFMIHQCAFMKMMRASDNHDYQLWVAMASQLQPFGDRGRDVFMKISLQDSHLAPEIIEQKWEQTRSMSPVRCTTIERWGWRCQHLDTVRCNGAPTPALLTDHSYCEPTEVEIRW